MRAVSPAPTPTPTPTPRPPGGNQPVTPSTVTGSPIILPRAGSVALYVLSTNTFGTSEEIGLDQPTHTLLIPNAINNVGAKAEVGTFAAGTSLVFYLRLPASNTTYLSTGDHAQIVVDGVGATQIGFEDSNDFDYNDVIVRVCYDDTGSTCVRDPRSSFGPGGGPFGSDPTARQAEPVNTATGNYSHHDMDMSLPGRGLPFVFTRTYNSLDTSSGSLSQGWTYSYATHLEFGGDGSVTLVDESGARRTFIPDGQGGFVGQAGTTGGLTFAGGVYSLRRHDQVVYHYDSAGRLTNEVDRNGNTITFSYTNGDLTTITDTVGRATTLTYNANGRLETVADPTGRSVTYGYDTNLRLATVTDLTNGVTRFTYDGSGRLKTITDPNTHDLVTNTYGPDGRVGEQVDARGFHTTFVWDPATETSTMTDTRGGAWVDKYTLGVLISQADPLGNVTRFGWDASLNAASVTDPRGKVTESSYDAQGNMVHRLRPLLTQDFWAYNAQNNMTSHIDARGNTTTYTYDVAGNLKTVTGPPPVNALTTYNYDPSGNGLLISIIDPRNKTTTFGYDAQANRNRMTTPLGFSTTMTYDGAGRILTRVDPRGNVTGADPTQFTTTFTHDGAGRLRTTTDPLNHTTTITYDAAGNRQTVADANTHTTTFGYNESNELTSVTDPRTKVTAYTYDGVGDLLTRTDANNHLTTYGYDLARRLTSETKPLNRVWTYAYDAANNRTQVVDAFGNSTPQTGDGTTTFTYDDLNRLSGITYSDGTHAVTYEYNANDDRTVMNDGVTNTYAYDPMNRMTQANRSPNLEMDYTYDAASNVLTRTPLGGTAVSYTYDDDGRMATMVSGGLTTSYGYDAAANILSTTLPSANGYVETRTYDRAGDLTEVKNTKGATTLSKSTYTLDPVGNRLSMITTTGTTTYTYDDDDRLTQACFTTGCAAPGDNFRRYTYDDVGNRLTDVRDTGTTTYTYDVLDQLSSTSGPGGTTNYTYDLDGNETAAGTKTFTYDLPGRTKTATVAGTTYTYTVDGDGKRLSAATGPQANKTTKFLWDSNRPLPQLTRELDGNGGLLREYQYGQDLVSMKAPTSTYYFHRDGLGSVTNVTSSTGNAMWTYTYNPYGETRTETKNNNQAPTNSVKFAGQYLDPTSLYHLRARQYDPVVGRFLTIDPAQSQVSDPYVSSYAYALDNPIVNSDPNGRWTVGVCIGLNFNFLDILSAEIVPVCVVAATSLQVGIISSAGGGGQIGASGSVAGLVQISNADYVQDLAGPFANLGGSTEYGGGVSGSVFAGYGRCRQLVEGVTFGPSLGGGAEGHLTVTGTNVWVTIGASPSGCPAK